MRAELGTTQREALLAVKIPESLREGGRCQRLSAYRKCYTSLFSFSNEE